MTEVRLGVDQRSLDALRGQARDDPKAAVKQAAEQFEALFMRQLLKTMRDSIPRSDLTDSAGERMAQELLDDQLVGGMVGRPGGLGATIARHLSRHMADGAVPEVDGMNPGVATPVAAQRAPRQLAAGGVIDIGRLPATLSTSLQAGRPALPDSREARFVASLWPHAAAAERATGVPAAFVVGQAALESGWGGAQMRHPDGRPAHNLFGIKAGRSWQGETVDVLTTEYIDGQRVQQVERFRAYESYEAAFTDWAGLMNRHPRYRDVLRHAGSAESFANGLQSAGYATDPDYADKLQRVIQRAVALREELI